MLRSDCQPISQSGPNATFALAQLVLHASELGNGQGGSMSNEGSAYPTVKRLSAALGAEITGLSLRNPSEELAETIEALLLELGTQLRVQRAVWRRGTLRGQG